MSIQQMVINALKSVHAYAESIEGLRKALKGKSRDTVRATLLPYVAAFYGVAVIDGEGKAKGTKVLDKAHKKYEGARKALSRLTDSISGKVPQSNSRNEQVVVPKRVLDSVLSVVFDAGLTKKEFDALIAEMRAHVAFK
jgi:hypothetical protein